MKRIHFICAIASLLLAATSSKGDEPTTAVPEVAWGKIIPGGPGTGVLRLDIKDWPADGKLSLPTPFANITRAYFADDANRKPLIVEYNADATSIALHLPETIPENSSGQVLLETAEKSEQFADGRIVLSALDAQIVPIKKDPSGSFMKLESHPGHHRILFGTYRDEGPRWEYVATRPGIYEVELTYSALKNSDAELLVILSDPDEILEVKPLATDSICQFNSISMGRIYLPAADTYYITVVCGQKKAPSGVRLKAITLRPACEGNMPRQAADGTITCHARDVTIQGVKVQYEPKPEKNTIGYWVNEKDWVYWDFIARQAGEYNVEILQGCGTGHGGSEVEITIAGQKLPLTVEDTGHFQNFKPRTIGTVKLTPGQHRLSVMPVKKARLAIMDLRQVRLLPVKPVVEK
jgi:hypothetical protein